MDRLCRCGHPESEHRDLGTGECSRAGEHAECACAVFRRVPTCPGCRDRSDETERHTCVEEPD